MNFEAFGMRNDQASSSKSQTNPNAQWLNDANRVLSQPCGQRVAPAFRFERFPFRHWDLFDACGLGFGAFAQLRKLPFGRT
jgi:hypothetical protein